MPSTVDEPRELLPGILSTSAIAATFDLESRLNPPRRKRSVLNPLLSLLRARRSADFDSPHEASYREKYGIEKGDGGISVKFANPFTGVLSRDRTPGGSRVTTPKVGTPAREDGVFWDGGQSESEGTMERMPSLRGSTIRESLETERSSGSSEGASMGSTKTHGGGSSLRERWKSVRDRGREKKAAEDEEEIRRRVEREGWGHLLPPKEGWPARKEKSKNRERSRSTPPVPSENFTGGVHPARGRSTQGSMHRKVSTHPRRNMTSVGTGTLSPQRAKSLHVPSPRPRSPLYPQIPPDPKSRTLPYPVTPPNEMNGRAAPSSTASRLHTLPRHVHSNPNGHIPVRPPLSRSSTVNSTRRKAAPSPLQYSRAASPDGALTESELEEQKYAPIQSQSTDSLHTARTTPPPTSPKASSRDAEPAGAFLEDTSPNPFIESEDKASHHFHYFLPARKGEHSFMLPVIPKGRNGEVRIWVHLHVE